MERERNKIFIKLVKNGRKEGEERGSPREYSWHALAFYFVRWLIIQVTKYRKTSGGGGFARFSYFMYVTCCRLALV